MINGPIGCEKMQTSNENSIHLPVQSCTSSLLKNEANINLKSPVSHAGTYSLCSAARSLCRRFLNQFDIYFCPKNIQISGLFIFVVSMEMTYLHCCESRGISQFSFLAWRRIRIVCVPFAQDRPWFFLLKRRIFLLLDSRKWRTREGKLLWNSSWSLRHPKSCAAMEICVGLCICRPRRVPGHAIFPLQCSVLSAKGFAI